VVPRQPILREGNHSDIKERLRKGRLTTINLGKKGDKREAYHKNARFRAINTPPRRENEEVEQSLSLAGRYRAIRNKFGVKSRKTCQNTKGTNESRGRKK